MKNLDLHSKLAILAAIAPVSVADNTAQVGAIVDRQGFGGLEYAIALGAIADADATFTVLLEHGDQADLSDATAVPDADLLGTEAEAGFQFDDDNETRKLGYRGNKRFTRLTITPVNNAAAALISAVAILGGAEDSPVA